MEMVARPKVYVAWGTAPELSNYDDSCRTMVDVCRNADKHIIVDPRMTNLGKEADLWLNLRPGTDGAMALAWNNVVVNHDLIDDLFVKKWTNAPFLKCDDIEPDGGEKYRFASGTYELKTTLLKESDIKEGGSKDRFMVWDNLNNRLTWYDSVTGMWEGEDWKPPTAGKEAQQDHLVPGVSQVGCSDPTGFSVADGFEREIDPALFGEFDVTLKDGRTVKVRPVWEMFCEHLEDYTPRRWVEITGVPAEKIEEVAIALRHRGFRSATYGNGGIHYQLRPSSTAATPWEPARPDILVSITGNRCARRCLIRHQGDYVQKAGPGSVAPGQPGLPVEITEKTIGIEDYPVLSWWQSWGDDASIWKAVETGDLSAEGAAVLLHGATSCACRTRCRSGRRS
ncbi:MAG: hypothetical protein ACLTDR_04455 [Adlercreutzia equolifaciens]